MSTLVGTFLGQGRYQIKQKLGEGGMALVFLALDRNVGIDVVIKVPKPIILADPEFASRFKHEIRSMVQLAHPHIVKIQDVGEHQGLPYYVMELLIGGSLEDRIQAKAGGNRRLMAPESLGKWLEAVASALDFIHSQGVVHRDIKPANILFDRHGNAFVSDFGIAKAISNDTAMKKMTVMTQAGMVLGTGPYLAPEVALGEKYDGSADQYALAATVYEVLGGRVPFGGTSLQAIIVQQTTGKIRPLHELVPGLPKELSQVIARGLHQDARKRYRDCAAFARAAIAAVDGVPNTAFKSAGPALPGLKSACPTCKKSIRLPSNPEGKTITCPACGAKHAVAKKPAAIGAAETSVAVAPDARTRLARRLKSAAASSNTKLFILAGLGAFVLLSCAGLSLALGVGWLMFGGKNPQLAEAKEVQVAKADPVKPAAPPVVDPQPELPIFKAPVLPALPPVKGALPPVQPPVKAPLPPVQNPIPPVQNPAPPGDQVLKELGLGRYLFESMVRVTDLAAKAKNVKDYGYVDHESIVSAWVKERQSVSFSMYLQANTDYLFLAAGDNDAEIIDLEVYDGLNRVAWDQTNHRDAIVTFTPPFTGLRQLKVTLFQSRAHLDCFCSMVVLKRGGWTVDFKNLDDATYSLAKQVADWNKLNNGKQYEFRKAPNQWSVFGGVLRPGGDLDIINTDLGFGNRALFASCDKLSNQLEVSILRNKKLLLASSGPVPTAPSLQWLCAGAGYQIRLRNNSTLQGASVAMMGVLDVKNVK